MVASYYASTAIAFPCSYEGWNAVIAIPLSLTLLPARVFISDSQKLACAFVVGRAGFRRANTASLSDGLSDLQGV